MGVSSRRACLNIYCRKIQIEKGCIMAYDTPSFSTFSKNIQMFVGSGLGNGLHKSLGLYSDFFGLLHLDKVNSLQFILCFLKIYCIFAGDMAYLLLP